jgi:hypothetical protein
MVGITAKGTAIHRTRRRQEGEDFGVSSVERLRRELAKVLALPIAGRGDVARSASPQDRRPTKQVERSGHTNPVQLMPPRFEHEHEDDLVAAPLLCASLIGVLVDALYFSCIYENGLWSPREYVKPMKTCRIRNGFCAQLRSAFSLALNSFISGNFQDLVAERIPANR